ncbi:MAG: glycosyltransferase family 2 protein [Lachnospiraceae bacterium]|nr:glycosyltransferase family 2 protein [Lachnospiraceae bacterium]
MKKISFCIPCYKSEQTLPKVVEEIRETMSGLSDRYVYEIILVNDASPDATFIKIKELVDKYPNITGIDLAKNFGQHAALMAGFAHVSGDILVCLDDDGQTPPNEVTKLLDKIEEGEDVVYAKYDHKKHSLFRNFGSFLNEKMTEFMLGKPKELYVSSYFAARRFIVDEMLKYDKSYPYVIGLVLRSTKRIANVSIDHREREVGKSGYTFGKLLGLWMNGFTAFSVKPLRIATWSGIFCAVLGFLYGIYTIIKKLVLGDVVAVGFSALMSAVMFLGGMILFMLGMLGEYIGRMYMGMNNAPQYVIREVVGKDE